MSGNCAAAGAGLTYIFSGGRIDIDGWTGSWMRVFDGSDEIEPELPGGAGSPIGNFVDTLMGRAEPATSVRNGVVYSELMDAVYASHHSGRPEAPPG